MSRNVYIHSHLRDYMEIEYIEIFEEKNAKLIEGSDAELIRFINTIDVYMQLDTETNVTDFHSERDLYVIQLGNFSGTEQHIIDFKDCSPSTYKILLGLFEGDIKFIAHNAKFEYMVLKKFFGVSIKYFKDTMLASKLITAGLDVPSGYNGLANLILLRFGVDLSKGAQTTFTGEKMSAEQLLYADSDVLYLGQLLDALESVLKRWKLLKCFALENKSLRAIGDLTINGILINQDALAENILTFEVNALKYKQEMIEGFKAETNPTIKLGIEALKIIQKEDEIVINWRSHVQKKAILQYLYPDATVLSSAKKTLEKLEGEVDNPKYITMILNGDTAGVEDILISRHMQFLEEHDMMIKKGNLNINFNSNDQLLTFFKLWYPNLKSVGVKALKKLKNPVVTSYKVYSKANKLVTSFGSKMYTFIEKDGRIRSDFNQLVPTGSRLSSRNPNMQQAPSTEQYRRIFVPQEGWKLVDSDYSSMEVFLAADMSQDVKMLEAIAKGYDMHAYSASLIFGQAWLDAGGSATPIGKPKTKEANNMRKISKGASFSLFYGTGVVAFSENNGLALAEGKRIMKVYYDTFPELAKFFKDAGKEALQNNFVREPYFGRVRFFNKPKNGMEASHNKNAGMNFKPQAANGSIMKYAMCKVKKYIDDTGVGFKVRMLLTVHDQLVSEARDDYAEEWAEIQTRLMEEAAAYCVKNKSIKAESDILEHWTKG